MKDRLSAASAGGKIILKAALIALIGSALTLSWVPPVDRDALTHHLAVPKMYLEQGGIYEIPSVPFSYYPMNLDLLFLIPLYFGNDIVPKLIHLAFGLFTAILIYRYLSRRLNQVYALIGVLLFLSLPVIIKLSITVYVDLGLIFFSTASLLYCLKWIESKYRFKYLALSAVCCGLALGVKYNGLVIFCLLGLFVPFLYSRAAGSLNSAATSDQQPDKTVAPQEPRADGFQLKAIGYGLAFVIIAMIIFSPWLIRNYHWTGNPVYPLYQSFFAARSVETTTSPEQAEIQPKVPWVHFSTRKYVYHETDLEIILVPLRVFFQGRDNDPQYFDGILNPYLFFLPLLAFLIPGENRRPVRMEMKTLMAFAILYLLFAFLSVDMRIRYIAPIIPPLVILSVFGLSRLWEIPTRSVALRNGCRIVLCLAMLIFCGKNLAYLHQQFQLVAPLQYISGKIDRDAYIERFRPEYAAFQFANANLARSSLILSMYLGNRLYYSDREMIFDDNLLINLGKQTPSADQIVDGLKQKNFTHLLIYLPMLEKNVNDSFNEQQKAAFTDFFQQRAMLLFHKSGYGLFELVNDA